MNLSKELIHKISSNYCKRHRFYSLKAEITFPSLFHNVIEKDYTLYKCWCYTYLPAEEFDLRNELKKEILPISQRKGSWYINERLCEGVAREKNIEILDMLKELRDDCVVVENADFLFPIQIILRKNTPLTIKEIREIIGKVEVGEYTEGEKNILEKKSYYNLPASIQIERIIELNEKIKIELETEFLPCPDLLPPDLNKIKLELEALPIRELLQRFKNTRVEKAFTNPVWNIDLNPPIEYSMIFSYKGERVELPYNLLHPKRYYPLIRKIAGKYRVERKGVKDTRDIDLGSVDYKKLIRKPLFSDAVMKVLDLAKEYRGLEKHGFFPGYLKALLRSKIRDEWKGETTTTLLKERSEWRAWDERGVEAKRKTKEPVRKLKIEIDYSGGSLDDEICIGEDTEGTRKKTTRIDLLADKDKEGKSRIIYARDEEWFREEDSHIEELDNEELNREKLAKELINSLSDPTDKAIIEKHYMNGETMVQIAKDLGISQPAVSKRHEKILKDFEKYLKKIAKLKK